MQHQGLLIHLKPSQNIQTRNNKLPKNLEPIRHLPTNCKLLEVKTLSELHKLLLEFKNLSELRKLLLEFKNLSEPCKLLRESWQQGVLSHQHQEIKKLQEISNFKFKKLK